MKQGERKSNIERDTYSIYFFSIILYTNNGAYTANGFHLATGPVDHGDQNTICIIYKQKMLLKKSDIIAVYLLLLLHLTLLTLASRVPDHAVAAVGVHTVYAGTSILARVADTII